MGSETGSLPGKPVDLAGLVGIILTMILTVLDRANCLSVRVIVNYYHLTNGGTLSEAGKWIVDSILYESQLSCYEKDTKQFRQ